jgi:cell division protein ZapA (FtsZ GTPase activity inhibitor)
MTFLKISQDAITVSTLPHPVSMFFLGVSFIISLYIYFELVKLRGDIRAITKENNEIKEKIRNTKIEVDKSVGELSKKVDSRVDKAIESIKKLANK